MTAGPPPEAVVPADAEAPPGPPFLQALGISLVAAGPSEARVALMPSDTCLDEKGAAHVSAIFALLEAAATALGRSALQAERVIFFTRAAELRHRKPGRGELSARAWFAQGEKEQALSRVSTEGKVDLKVLIEVTDPTAERIAEASVTLGLRRT